MNLILKQVGLGILTFFTLTALIITATFITFPLENWRLFWTGEIFEDVPYLIFIASIVLIVGAITGLSYVWYMKKNMRLIKHQKTIFF